MPSQRVYIGNLGSDVRERDIEKFFKGFGKLGEISIKNGYGFVDFDDYRDADDAVHDLDGKDIRGVRVRVELARERRDRRDGGDRRGGRGGDRFGGDRRDRFGGRDDRRGGDRGGRPRGAPPGRKTEYRLIVENMSSKTSWQDLKDYFRAAGEITYTNAHKPRQGEGIVEFADRRGLDYALDKLDNTELDGRKIRLVEEGGRGGGRGGGGARRSASRSKSRSRSRSRSRSERRSRSPASRSRSGSRGSR